MRFVSLRRTPTKAPHVATRTERIWKKLASCSLCCVCLTKPRGSERCRVRSRGDEMEGLVVLSAQNMCIFILFRMLPREQKY